MDGPAPSTTPAPRRLLPAALVALCSFAAFAPALAAGFVNWDDGLNFLENPHYRGFSARTLRWMFTDFSGGLYIPFTWLTLAADYALWGMDARGYHLTSLLIHAANGALCFLFLAALLDRVRPDADAALRTVAAAAGALFFAVHPLRAESVAWITERRDLTSGFFTLLTLLAYLRATRDPEARTRRLAVAAALYAASLLCKPAGMTLPAVLLVLDVYPLRRLDPGLPRAAAIRPLLIEKIPFFVLAAGAVVLTRLSLASADAFRSDEALPFLQRLLEPGRRLSFYALKVLAPWGLSPMYFFRPGIGWPHVAGTLAVAGVTAGLWFRRREWPAALAGWLGFLILLAPVAGLVQAGYHFAADRYTYLPSLAAAAAAAAGLLAAGPRFPAARIAALAAVALLGVLAWRQTLVWSDSVTLWTRALEVDPSDPVAAMNRAKAREETGDLAGALADYTRCIEQGGRTERGALLNRGSLKQRTGDLRGAVEDYTRCLALDPRNAKAWTSRGLAREKGGDSKGAREDYDRALDIEPGYAVGRTNRGEFLGRTGDLDGGLADANAAIAANPDYCNAWVLRASLRRRKGDAAGALEDLGRAVATSTPTVEAFANRAGLLLQAGRATEALADYTRAVALAPDNPSVRLGRAQAYKVLGAAPDAAADLRKALQQAPPSWPLRADAEALLRGLPR